MGVKVKEWKGAWWVFVNHQGRRKAKRVGDRKTANEVAKQIRRKLAEGAFRLAPAGPRFAELAEEWLTKYPLLRSISQSSLENYASFVRHHLITYFGEMLVSDITAETVEEFIAAKRSNGSVRFKGRGLAEGSLRTGLIALRLILERAVKAGFLPGNPARGVGRFPVREEDSVDPFARDELRRIIVAAQEQDPAFATLLRVWIQTGMRAGEVAGLRWGDLVLPAAWPSCSGHTAGAGSAQPRLGGAVLSPCSTRLPRKRPSGSQEPRWTRGRSCWAFGGCLRLSIPRRTCSPGVTRCHGIPWLS